MLLIYSVPNSCLCSNHIVTEEYFNSQMVLELVEEQFTTWMPQPKRGESK